MRGDVHAGTQHLGLGHTGITNQQAVDVTTQVGAVLQVLLQAAKHEQHQAPLDDLVAIDGGREGVGQGLQHGGLLSQAPDVASLLHGVLHLVLLSELLDGDADHHGLEHSRCLARCLAGQCLVHTHNADPVTRLDLIDQIILEDNFSRVGQLTGRSSLGELLHGNHLAVLVLTETILSGQQIAVVILLGVLSSGWEAAKGCDITVLAAGKSLGSFAVVDALHHLGSDQRAFGYDAEDAYQLVEPLCCELTWGYLVAAKVTLQSHMQFVARFQQFQKCWVHARLDKFF
mmetsp:Transcript_27203/g.59414  ORF Transcript_27203/g.59414 Transcript_27203/m.59414 type:complete len:287 (+) Transcript_27203:2205-3065(+)